MEVKQKYTFGLFVNDVWSESDGGGFMIFDRLIFRSGRLEGNRVHSSEIGPNRTRSAPTPEQNELIFSDPNIRVEIESKKSSLEIDL